MGKLSENDWKPNFRIVSWWRCKVFWNKWKVLKTVHEVTAMPLDFEEAHQEGILI